MGRVCCSAKRMSCSAGPGSTGTARFGVVWDTCKINGGVRVGAAESQTLSLSLVRLGTVLGSASATNRVFNSRGETLYGWTVGGGVEYAINRNWTIRGEYLYADYGDLSVFLPALPTFNTLASASRFDFTTHTARVALNYRF
jgi:opacity protein-like surface antigen